MSDVGLGMKTQAAFVTLLGSRYPEASEST